MKKMLGEKTVKTLMVFLITTTLFLTGLTISIQGNNSGCSSYHAAALDEQDTDNDGLAGNITVEPVAWPLWFQVIAFPPRDQPLYQLIIKNYNNRSIDCYVKQELTVYGYAEQQTSTEKRGKILLTMNKSYTLEPYSHLVPWNPVSPFFKVEIMLEHPEFKTGLFSVYVELYVPEDGSKNNVSFSGFYFHGFVWIFGCFLYTHRK
ncbi:MAG TPA: hypothetical protein ENI45_00405 [Thermoplasmatales archaeon]|nr:hypothetical protein [Thermoplasmatales archaeon]